MSSRKYSKLVMGSFLLILISILMYSCKDSTTVVGTSSGTTTGNVTVSVTSPKNGDTLKVASTFTIQWSSNSTSTVKIEFSTDQGATWILIADNVANNGAYLWYPIPNLVTTQGIIRITTDDKQANGISTGFFNISKSAIKVLALSKPIGGEVLYINDTFRVEWVSTGISSIKLEYSVNNGSSWTPITLTYPADSSFYLWGPIPNSLSDQCFLRITDVSDASVTDKSKSAFSIANPPEPDRSISMVSPTTGQQWIGGTINEIRWTSKNIDSVKLEYTIDGGADWFTIAAKIPSSGYYNWVVPKVTFSSDNCLIRVSDARHGFPISTTGSFSIYSSKVLRWIYPNGGETINDSIIIVTWISAGIDNVNIEYTVDNAQSWIPVISNLHSTGAYPWVVPKVPPSTLARLRITDSNDPFISDMSDGPFIIGTGALKLISPISNNTYSASSGMSISWTGIGIISSVKLEYSSDNGRSWKLIAADLLNDANKINKYIWYGIPQGIKGNILIRLTDTLGKYSARSRNIFIN